MNTIHSLDIWIHHCTISALQCRCACVEGKHREFHPWGRSFTLKGLLKSFRGMMPHQISVSLLQFLHRYLLHIVPLKIACCVRGSNLHNSHTCTLLYPWVPSMGGLYTFATKLLSEAADCLTAYFNCITPSARCCSLYLESGRTLGQCMRRGMVEQPWVIIT